MSKHPIAPALPIIRLGVKQVIQKSRQVFLHNYQEQMIEEVYQATEADPLKSSCREKELAPTRARSCRASLKPLNRDKDSPSRVLRQAPDTCSHGFRSLVNCTLTPGYS